GHYHHGDCLKGKGVCYYCKELGHMRHECPEWRKRVGSSATTKNKG
ncbi:hypothetical protein A2U01_0101255, partial [Trifolium medium]|nr:hypothetical protein [Trifolium medium]